MNVEGGNKILCCTCKYRNKTFDTKKWCSQIDEDINSRVHYENSWCGAYKIDEELK